jgi:hypothetical protein
MPTVANRKSTLSCSTKRRNCSTVLGGVAAASWGKIYLSATDATLVVDPLEEGARSLADAGVG